MQIMMTGINHQHAGLSQRECFAHSDQQLEALLQKIRCTAGVAGCVILSTCNRTELWVSATGNPQVRMHALFGLLACREGAADQAQRYVYQGDAAVANLIQTACGLNSQLLWEDQILAQVKQALALASRVRTVNEDLQRLFQTAIACGKQVKTQIKQPGISPSTAKCVAQAAKAVLGQGKGVRCLILGSGQMGRQVAAALLGWADKVTMAVRSHHAGISLLPGGCEIIPFERRYEALANADLVIGATRSPHFTLLAKDAAPKLGASKQRLYIDLAVPRDFEPAIAHLPGITLLNVDELARYWQQGDVQPVDQQAARQAAGRLIDASVNQFSLWQCRRRQLPLMQEVAQEVAEKISRHYYSAINPQEGAVQGDLLHDTCQQAILSMLLELQRNPEESLTSGLKRYVQRQRERGAHHAAT